MAGNHNQKQSIFYELSANSMLLYKTSKKGLGLPYYIHLDIDIVLKHLEVKYGLNIASYLERTKERVNFKICTGGPHLLQFLGPGKNHTMPNSY